MSSKQRIFSGVQPSGNLHIGNYLGAIANWVKLQEQYDSIFCVVDMHAITVPQDPETLRKKTLEIAKIYLAAGIDPKKSTIFIQSQVSAHAELAWVLNTIAKMSELDKMTQFKDKSQKGATEGVGVGLYDYPVLMAADILLYGTEVVPVGEDQKQHVELARDLAKRFNQKFGETFIVPDVYMMDSEGMLAGRSLGVGGRVMGLDNPEKKMSKSAESIYNRIELLDDAEMIRKKIKKAVTDSGSEIIYSDDKPALKNLINIYSSFSGKTFKEIELMYAGKGYGDFKAGLAEVIIGFLSPFQERYEKLEDKEVLKILKKGAQDAQEIADKKMETVKKKIGFVV